MIQKPCVIFDLDDTLSDCQWRSPLLEPQPGETKKNWPAFFAACGQDPERERLVRLAKSFVDAGALLIILTGRQETYRAMSEQWLGQRGLNPHLSEFRPDHDFKPDHALKDAWVARLQEQGYEILAAFDDRDHNVEVFRARGILAANALKDEEVERVASEGMALLEARLARQNARPARSAPRPTGARV